MKTKIYKTSLRGLLLVEIGCFEDDRGFFIEPWNKKDFKKAGLDLEFVQEGHSGSEKDVLRGLHSQDSIAPMGKLVRCTIGTILDVSVDVRSKSRTFGDYYSVQLTAKNKLQLYVPPGFAHGFVTLSDYAEIQYKQTGFYAPKHEFGIMWDDSDIGIKWPIKNPIISEKDSKNMSFKDYKRKSRF